MKENSLSKLFHLYFLLFITKIRKRDDKAFNKVERISKKSIEGIFDLYKLLRN